MDEEKDELIPARKAQALLGISNQKLAKLLENNILPFVRDPLDNRMKLVRMRDVEALMAQSVKKGAA